MGKKAVDKGKNKRKASDEKSSEADPISINLRDVVVNSQSHLQSILRSVALSSLAPTDKKRSADRVFAMAHLVPSATYAPGEPLESKKIRTRGKNKLSKPVAAKAVAVPPGQTRGTLEDRKQDHNRLTYDARVDTAQPYAWLRDWGFRRCLGRLITGRSSLFVSYALCLFS